VQVFFLRSRAFALVSWLFWMGAAPCGSVPSRARGVCVIPHEFPDGPPSFVGSWRWPASVPPCFGSRFFSFRTFSCLTINPLVPPDPPVFIWFLLFFPPNYPPLPAKTDPPTFSIDGFSPPVKFCLPVSFCAPHAFPLCMKFSKENMLVLFHPIFPFLSLPCFVFSQRGWFLLPAVFFPSSDGFLVPGTWWFSSGLSLQARAWTCKSLCFFLFPPPVCYFFFSPTFNQYDFRCPLWDPFEKDGCFFYRSPP